MSCWRILELTEEPQGETTPQLLIKPQFGLNKYTVFLTDLSNIWSEELDLAGIVRRATEVESPIEVTERDTTQLAILFESVQKSLDRSDNATCTIASQESEGLILQATISLPEPLDSLTWKFHLHKRTAVTLKDELILPLLVSSHVQQERMSSLLSVISDKDRAITRLVEQYESSNLDLAAAFPSIGNFKSGRKIIKREQAARHVPGLKTFDPNAWRKETDTMVDDNVSTLGLFQEALSQCTPKVPTKLKSGDENILWWRGLGASVDPSKQISTKKSDAQEVQPKRPLKAVRPTVSESETEEEETEDEFETHEHFKSRNMPNPPLPAVTEQELDLDPIKTDKHVDMDQDEDSDDLDALVKSQSQRQSQSRNTYIKARSPTPPEPTPPEPTPPEPTPPEPTSALVPRDPSPKVPRDPSPKKPKAKGFKIGGRPTKTESPPQASLQEARANEKSRDAMPMRSRNEKDVAEVKSTRKGFKIGGRSKAQVASLGEESAALGDGRATRETSTITHSASIEPSPSAATKTEEDAAMEDAREETEEEKIERRRQELKRKNEELAKKQAQSKRKKRF